MQKVAKIKEKDLKAKINVSLDADLVDWIEALVRARGRQGKDGRSTVINEILKAKHRRSCKRLVD